MSVGLLVRGLVAAVLAGVAVWCALHGVVERPSTGGLLLAPVETVRVVGAWTALAVVTGTAALLVVLGAVGRAPRPDRRSVSDTRKGSGDSRHETRSPSGTGPEAG